MRITEHYLIHADVPFLDVHLDHDNQLFLDPSAIRNATGREISRVPVRPQDIAL